MKYLFSLLALLLSFHAAAAEETAFTVLTYNIKGLPAFIARDFDEERYSEIGDILAERQKKGDAPDIVMLQESFVERTRELRDRAGYPHMAKGPNSAKMLGVDSGLYILSKFPIVENKNIAFGEGLCSDWDCYSNKGVQFARIEIPGSPVSVELFNTHMQASRAFDSVRQQQVEVLAKFVKENHRPGSAVLFGGDFNFRPSQKQGSYSDFLKKTALINAGEYCATHACPDPGKKLGFWDSLVDHQFIAAQEASPLFRLLPTAMARSFSDLVRGRRLSDHQGLEMKYRLSWGKPTLAQKVKALPSTLLGREKLIRAEKN